MSRSHLLVCALLFAALPHREVSAQTAGANVLQNPVPESIEHSREEAERRWQAGRAALTSDALQGPPRPSVMYAVLDLNEQQLAQFLAAYRAHMAATWNARWAVVSALKMLDRAARNSDFHAVRYYNLLTNQLWRHVRAQDEGFEVGLGPILDEKQLKRYREWKDAWQRATWLEQRLDAGGAVIAVGGDQR